MSFEEFTKTVLIPEADKILTKYYADYCAGNDINIQTKADKSPASLADREAEKTLRVLINVHYPNHGIWGEEFGGENLEAEYVWVLDPLDGTKQFLAKQDGHFVVLIGLFKNKSPYFGAASDPISSVIWTGDKTIEGKINPLENMIIASTAPDEMFKGNIYEIQIEKLLKKVNKVIEFRNAKSFLDVIDGTVDVGIESSLSLHDIGALIPILKNAGCVVTDFDGNPYDNNIFEFNYNQYDFLVTRNIETTNRILNEIRK